MYSFLGYIGIKYFRGIPMYLEYMVLCTYIGNARLRAFPMYYCTSFSRRYIGIEISKPIPMYVGSNLNKIYIGMGQYRPSPMYRQILPKQNTSEFRVFIQSRCISINFPRFYPLSLAVYSRASRKKQAKYIGIHQLMAIPMYSNNFPRMYLHPLVVYSRAGQPQEWNI